MESEKNEKKIGRILAIILAVLLGLFLLWNAAWFIWRAVRYGSFADGMEKTVFATVLTPRYGGRDEDGFDYGVKFPDYLSFTGNLSVGIPSEEEFEFTDALIVWPGVFGGWEYGVLLYEEDCGYNIYVDEDGNCLDEGFEDVVERHRGNVDALLTRAREQFGIPGGDE